MINPKKNAEIVLWLADNSKRPKVAVKVWAVILSELCPYTGLVKINRDWLADRIGCRADHVGQIMKDLVQIEAVTTSRGHDLRRIFYTVSEEIVERQEREEREEPAMKPTKYEDKNGNMCFRLAIFSK